MIRFVYLAGPITKPSPMQNTHRAIHEADRLVAAGYLPFVPHLTVLWDVVSPHDYEWYMRYDHAWLSRCDALVRLSGESPGADREEQWARERGIPVFYGVDELLERGSHEDQPAKPVRDAALEQLERQDEALRAVGVAE